MLTLDEAIKHCEEKARDLRCSLLKQRMADIEEDTDCIECASEHEQLAEWLTELKELREYCRLLCKGVQNLTDEECRYVIAIESKQQLKENDK